MEKIIQQIGAKFVKNVLEYYSKNGICEIGIMADDCLKIAKSTVKELLCAFIADADEALVALKNERKIDSATIHERRVPRTVFTGIGDITYERTYFKTPGGMSCILDGILGVDAYERVDAHVSAKLANAAGRASFARSSAVVTGGAVSRQTAWRKAMESGEVAALPDRVAKTPNRIHIFADEDHVHLQDGRGAILPIVTICSGKRWVCKGRNELVEKTHLCGYGLTPETFWGYVYATCAAKYDMSKVKEVFIYGDGATWIETSAVCFPGAVRVLDAYHYVKKMRTLTAGDIPLKYAISLRAAVSHGDKERFGTTVRCMMDELKSVMGSGRDAERKLSSVSEAADYLLARWDAVMNMKLTESIGSCTEAMVSHVLSERFSRSPMGWSKPGIAKMAQIRVYQENGGEVKPTDIGVCKTSKSMKRMVPSFISKYADLVKRQQEEVFAKASDWRIFENEHIELAAPSGTRVALDALARMRNIA